MDSSHFCSVFVTHAGRGHGDDPAAPLHSGGDGSCADGEEPVQREADGAPGGCAMDGDDQVPFQRRIFG